MRYGACAVLRVLLGLLETFVRLAGWVRLQLQ